MGCALSKASEVTPEFVSTAAAALDLKDRVGDSVAVYSTIVEPLLEEDVQAGIHLCYGDPGHKHIIEPADLGTCVAYSNGITSASPRAVDFIHMPVPRDRADDVYFAPLAGLDVADDTQMFIGLIHYTGGLDGTRTRLDTAVAHAGHNIGIGTECGFGRRDPATIPGLLKIHADAAV